MDNMIPSPIHTMLCSVWDLSWKDHQKQAEQRWWTKHDSFVDPAPGTLEVTLEDCVVLLKEAGLGPVGPSGPPGPAGLALR